MLSELFADAVARPASDGGIPGIVAAAGRGAAARETWTAGLADTVTAAPMTAGTVFDLASLTKVVSTTTLALSLAGSGALDLDAPASRYLPAAPWEVTIRQLLAHTSGLPSTVKFYETCSSRSALLDALFATPLEAAPGTRVAYSDLGFIILGLAVSAVTGLALDEAFRSLVARPLGLASTGYLPSGPASRFAATEFRDDGTPWRGTVHDENAQVMDGVAGHAGLFAPVDDLARFASWWVSPSDAVVPAALRRSATTCQTAAPSDPGSPPSPASGSPPGPGTSPGPGSGSGPPSGLGSGPGCPPGSGSGCLPGDGGLPGRRGLGWVLPGDRYDILAGAWPATSACHTGFTGTSLALDPASGAWLVLLTNRVHYGRTESAEVIKSLRRSAHIAAAPGHPG